MILSVADGGGCRVPAIPVSGSAVVVSRVANLPGSLIPATASARVVTIGVGRVAYSINGIAIASVRVVAGLKVATSGTRG